MWRAVFRARSAFQAALDRGWGRPAQAVDLGVEVQITKIEHKIVDPQAIEHEPQEGLALPLVSISVPEGDK